MFLIITENLIGVNEIRVLSIAFLLGVIYYSINWICSILYDNGYDIFKKANNKTKNKRNKRNKSWKNTYEQENRKLLKDWDRAWNETKYKKNS